VRGKPGHRQNDQSAAAGQLGRLINEEAATVVAAAVGQHDPHPAFLPADRRRQPAQTWPYGERNVPPLQVVVDACAQHLTFACRLGTSEKALRRPQRPLIVTRTRLPVVLDHDPHTTGIKPAQPAQQHGRERAHLRQMALIWATVFLLTLYWLFGP